MSDYFDRIKCGFKNEHIPQHCLRYMIEKIK